MLSQILSRARACSGTAIVALVAAVLATSPRPASATPYAAAGTYNATTYSFVATGTSVSAYYLGKTDAYYDEYFQVFDNGHLLTASNGSTGVLDDHTTLTGASVTYNTGIAAGDTLTFALVNATLNATAYSDPSKNGAYDALQGATTGQNHVYATAYSGSATAGAAFPSVTGVPAGLYIGFEDIPIGPWYTPDFSYDDQAIVVTNTSMAMPVAVPEPSTICILGIGLGGLAMLLARRRRPMGSAAA